MLLGFSKKGREVSCKVGFLCESRIEGFCLKLGCCEEDLATGGWCWIFQRVLLRPAFGSGGLGCLGSVDLNSLS